MFGTEFQIPKESAVTRLIADAGWGCLLHFFFPFSVVWGVWKLFYLSLFIYYGVCPLV